MATGKTAPAGGRGALARIRNTGIIAHIDAGKTTVSERILYYTGRTYKMGEVHDGAAVMDFDPEERARGITIASAATSCSWRRHTVNLIDTPGHVDFTAEVERSLRVLDGAIGVFCAVAGVQPQSETVWRQARRHGVPCVAFVNKMDRVGADLEACLDSMRRRLGVNPVPVVWPIGVEKSFRGIIDLVNERLIIYAADDRLGEEPSIGPVPAEGPHREVLERERERLVESLAELDDDLAERYLEGEAIAPAELRQALRRATLAGEMTPVLCGTALKNRGIQRLLDAIVDYLPSPLDAGAVPGVEPRSGEPIERPADPAGPLAALAFKGVADRTGDLTYVRVYAGSLSTGDSVYNPNRNKTERVGRIYRMHASAREQIEVLGTGEIGAVVGLKQTLTGDTLCAEEAPIALGSLRFPEPVITQAVMPQRTTDKDKLAAALTRLAREDPTFRRYTDHETGEVVIAGMGELHLEVLVNRLRRHYGCSIKVGPPRVAYRQTLGRAVDLEARHIKQTGGHGQYGVIKVRFAPNEAGTNDVTFEQSISGGVVPREYIPSVERGIRAVCAEGDRTGFPIVSVRAELYDGAHHPVDSSDLAFKEAGRKAMRLAMERAGLTLLEPVMSFEVVLPEAHVSGVIGDLGSRRAEVHEIAMVEGELRAIKGRVPLAEMFAYVTRLRSLTQGRGAFTMEPDRYVPAPRSVATRVREEAARRKR